MLVQFAHGCGLDGSKGSSEICFDGEGRRVEYFHEVPWDDIGSFLRPVVAVGIAHGEDACEARDILRGDIGWRWCTVEDAELIRWQAVKSRDGRLKGFGDDLLGFRSIFSVTKNVPSSLKSVRSKMSRNSQPSSSAWIRRDCQLGKTTRRWH